MGPFTCGEPLESEKLRSSTDAFSPPRPYFPSGSSTDAASLQKNIKRQPLKGPAEAEAAGLGPWGQVRLGFRREDEPREPWRRAESVGEGRAVSCGVADEDEHPGCHPHRRWSPGAADETIGASAEGD